MRQTGEIRALTGLRGLAACYVVVFHYCDGIYLAPVVSRVLTRGYQMVDLFFVLSGFVMAMVYGGLFASRTPAAAYAGFLWRRAGRVYPLFFAVTLASAVALVAGLGVGGPVGPVTLTANALLVQAWGLAPSIMPTSWSISTEFAAYLLFPWLLRAIVVGRFAAIAAALALAALAFCASRSPEALGEMHGAALWRNGPLDVYDATTPLPLLRCLAGFSLGLVAFRLVRHPAVARLAGRPAVGDAAALCVLGLLAVPDSDVLVVAAFVPMVLALATGRSVTARALASPIAHWLGEVSYSIYLVHMLVDWCLRAPIADALASAGLSHPRALAGVPMLPIMLGLSVATYYGIERPARAWSRRLAGFRLRMRGTVAP